MIVSDDPERARALERSLAEAGITVCCTVTDDAAVLRRTSEHAPDVIIIEMASPGRDILESLSLISAHHPTAMVMCSRVQDQQYIQRAIAAGVSTYLVSEFPTEQVGSVIDIAAAQFQAFQSLREQLADTQSALGAQRSIDRARALLISELQIDEEQAYECLRSLAMENRMKINEYAEKILAHHLRKASNT